jgi:hypothetical protein
VRDGPLRSAARLAIDLLLLPLGAALLLFGIARHRLSGRRRRDQRPRLLWGALPIRSIVYTSAAMRRAGYRSDTVTIDLYRLTPRDLFDHCLAPRGDPGMVAAHVVTSLKAFLFFARALVEYDLFHYFTDGGVMQRTLLARIELPLLRLCGKSVVLMAYGADAFVTDHLADLAWRHALMIEYQSLGRTPARIERRLRRNVRSADVVLGTLVHVVNLPRWDMLPLTWYPIDTDAVQPILPRNDGVVRIAHAPNHRGVKGSEFLIAAVERLRAEGVEIELRLIEGEPNARALELMREADIVVDQLVFGYALTALEGMALGKIVITGIEPDGPAYRLFRRYSYLGECPAFPASPETIEPVLRDLLSRRAEWHEIGARTRAFAERRHSFAAAQRMMDAVYRRLWRGEAVDLINWYHPVLGPEGRSVAS